MNVQHTCMNIYIIIIYINISNFLNILKLKYTYM